MPSQIDVDDLRGAGYLGLIEAADAFDASRGTPFGAYARARIHFAMVDYLRSLDMLSRIDRQRVRDGALQCFEVPFADLVAETTPCRQLSPLATFARSHVSPAVRAAIAALPARERYVVVEHCLGERPMVEIAADLGVSQGRVSQLKGSAIARLRRRLTCAWPAAASATAARRIRAVSR